MNNDEKLTNNESDYGYVYQYLEIACQELVGGGSIDYRLKNAQRHLGILHGAPQGPPDSYFPKLYSRFEGFDTLSESEKDELSRDILTYFSEVSAQCHTFIIPD